MLLRGKNLKTQQTNKIMKSLTEIQATYKNLGTANGWVTYPAEYKEMIENMYNRYSCYEGSTYELFVCDANKTFWKVFTA